MLQRRQSRDAEALRPAPAYFSQEQVGRQSKASNASLRSSLLRKISPTSATLQPVDSHRDFTADYLTDLRKNRPARPGGARPLPTRNAAGLPKLDRDLPARAGSALAMRPNLPNNDLPERSSSAMAHRGAQTSLDNREAAGRPLVKQPFPNVKSRDFSGATTTTTATTVTTATNATGKTTSFQGESQKKYSIPYYERGQRWMEKQEVSSLKHALADMDKKEEVKIHAAAQDEAAELVWKHQNPEETGVPYRNPDLYRQHLRKGSHARSQSTGPYSSLYIKKGGSDSQRSASEGSNSSGASGGSRVVSSSSAASGGSAADRGDDRGREPEMQKGYGSLKSRFSVGGPRALIKRRSSSAKGRTTSGESNQSSVFRNPNDQIYEEPEDATTITESAQDSSKPQPLVPKPRNTSYGSRIGAKENIDRAQTDPVKMVSRVDIYKNPPSQSRNPFYKRNNRLSNIEFQQEQPPMKDGKEIRTDDIRAATSMKLKDRSEKLPMPTIVSDRPGRPIVSFANDYKPREKELKEQSSSRPSTREGQNSGLTAAPKPPLPTAQSDPAVPMISISDTPAIKIDQAPAVPSINAPDVPSISLTNDTPFISIDAPAINVTPSTPLNEKPPSTRPLPKPGQPSRSQPGNRPLPHHFSTSPVKSSPHWTPAGAIRGQAQCAACALPISGRIVSAAKQRFHPACFTCFHCGEQLECVAFYPEPDVERGERLVRIQARQSGQPVPEEQSQFAEQDDGDDGLRFFCHLDFHEAFSPRCRSCKTPIEGEVVIACGGEWHVGHFFCAECGDPFDQNTPFVEKDGYAWCVGCHTRKFAGKCAGCKRPVDGVVVNAMEREWHEGCFVCCACGGDFGDGRFFVNQNGELRGLPVCVRCEERRLKA
ncbi:MAG: hypothetical protein MMC23_001784 [Stictis urceolatum]|nr:hypothetical protein [Stictis urceolata]